jgi:carbamoyl-phosphate synthase small subunit
MFVTINHRGIKMDDKAYLILENGTAFEGRFFGAKPANAVSGEIVFTTEMMGYIEALTDPNYHGQIVLHTFPLIGNYGIIPEDFLSDYGPAAYIIKHPCQDPSNFRSEGPLDTFLKERGITCICGVDTRAIAKIIRDNGTVYGTITANENDHVGREFTFAVSAVSTPKIERYKPESKNAATVGIIDFGMNVNLRKNILKRGYGVTVFPHETDVETVIKEKCAGLVLSNGPGDPHENIKVIQNIKSLLGHKMPILGVGLGHQLLALANGFRVEKLKSGHRGANQGIKDTVSGKVYITRQNHSYAVVSTSVNKKVASETYINVNDKSCEGIEYKAIPAFSVQFDPSKTDFVFDRFFKMLAKNAPAKQGGNR